MQTTSILSWRGLWAQIKKLFWLWLALAVAAGGAVVLIRYLDVRPDRAVMSTFSYNYDGAESGVDPAGNQLDPQDVKDLEILREAADRAGMSFTEERLAVIQDAISIRGRIPADVIERYTNYESIYSGEELPSETEVKNTSYFPTRYNIFLRYGKAGLSKDEGSALLHALLEAYIADFYALFGYNRQIENSVQVIDYSEYDYSRSIEVLDSSLQSLRSFVGYLSAMDNTRFVSPSTGYSFADLTGAIDVIRSEDLEWLTSYIDSNNITKDREELINYYSYRIDNYNRELASNESRLATLDELIADYVKTDAIILGIGEPNTFTGEQETYSFTQQSEMYDSLIRQEINCRTNITSVRERINYFQTRIERLSSAESTGDPKLVEQRLAQVDLKLKSLITAATTAAEEYYESVELLGAVQLLEEGEDGATGLVSLILNSFDGVVIAEGILFGAFVLAAVILALSHKEYGDNSRKTGNRKNSGKGLASGKTQEKEG